MFFHEIMSHEEKIHRTKAQTKDVVAHGSPNHAIPTKNIYHRFFSCFFQGDDQRIVNCWFGARRFGFLGSPYERDCYLRASLECQTTNPD